ncbi:MAG: hypothetical protein WC716_07530 [Chitinophagaceae bacterium]|jgi:hypothetical protein
MNIRLNILSTLLFACLLQINPASAQLKIERKIIIEKEQYYFFTIDEETQLATLHTGPVFEKLNKAKKYKMPIGRELNDPFNPLCFDINNGQLIGINWILNSNNSRYEALKKIDLKDWKKQHDEWTNEQWAQVSFDQAMLAPNEPWKKMLEVNNILDNTFFDLIKNENPVMAVCNQNQLWISRYNGTEWKISAAVPVNFKTYFSLIENNGKAFLVDNIGNVFYVDEDGRQLVIKSKATTTKAQLLIVDKDHKSYHIVPAEAIEAGQMLDIEKIIHESGTEIIF